MERRFNESHVVATTVDLFSSSKPSNGSEVIRSLSDTELLKTSRTSPPANISSPSSTHVTLQPRHRRSSTASIGRRESLDAMYNGSFFRTFGPLGLPTVVAFALSAAALFVQAYIQIYPEEFANTIMDTSEFDNGNFWLIGETDRTSMSIATALFIFCGASYVVLIFLMLFFRHKLIQTFRTHKKQITTIRSWWSITFACVNPLLRWVLGIKPRAPPVVQPVPNDKIHQANTVKSQTNHHKKCNDNTNTLPPHSHARQKRNSIAEIYAQLSPIDGTFHAYYMVFFDLPKLIFQSITLVGYLRKGFPLPVTIFYVAMLTINWFITIYRFQKTTIDHSLAITRCFYLFDLFFAVFAPVVALSYAYYNFHFDRAEFQTREDTLPAGTFDRTARLYADPTQLIIFKLGFEYLLLKSSDSIGIKGGLLLLSLYKWLKIVVYLVRFNHSNQRQLVISHVTKPPRRKSRRHLLVGILSFIGFAVGILTYTIAAIISSSRNCAPYPNCVVVAYKWYVNFPGCPCLVYINRKTDPKTYEEWIDPPDAMQELSILAQEGQLNTIQIVNRALPTLPDSVRNCKKLEQLILLYTKTTATPEWGGELTKLQYMHIQGDFTGRSLTFLPKNLYSHMSDLRFLRLGVIPQLTELPSFDGLSKLQYLGITAPHAMREFPNFDDLIHLRTLAIADAIHVHRLPSLQALIHLESFSLFYRNEMCCNGFMKRGQCNLSDFQCSQRNNEPAVVCVNESISATDLKVATEETTGTVCPKMAIDLIDTSPTNYTTDTLCDGVLFRQCQLGNTIGMCFNVRMQVIYCDTSGDFERLRRLQIALGVGIPCDPIEEAWLGCVGK